MKLFLRVYLIVSCTTGLAVLLLFLLLDKESIKWLPLIIIVDFVLWAPMTSFSLFGASAIINNYCWVNKVYLNIIASCIMVVIYYCMICVRVYLEEKELFPEFLCYFNGYKWCLVGFWGTIIPAFFSICFFIFIIITIEKIRKLLCQNH